MIKIGLIFSIRNGMNKSLSCHSIMNRSAFENPADLKAKIDVNRLQLENSLKKKTNQNQSRMKEEILLHRKQHRSKSFAVKAKLLKAFFCAFTILNAEQSTTYAQSLRGVGLYESNTFKGMSVSMAGGGYLNIAGKDGSFDGAAIANKLSFKTSDIGEGELTLNLPTMSEDDQFMSAPVYNRLVQTTPSISSLFNGTPLSSFEYLNEVDMKLTVTASSKGTKFTCGSNNCRVRYSWSYTPVIHYVVPAVVYPGMTISVGINPKNAPNYKKDDQLPLQLRLDGTSLDHTDSYSEDNNISRNKLQFMRGVVDVEQRRNATAEITAFFRGAGYAMNDTRTMPVCLYDGATCYNTKVMPTLSSVSHNSGFSTGGQNLTLTGTSFESENVVVTVDDLPCIIQKKSDQTIMCTTPFKLIEEKPAEEEKPTDEQKPAEETEGESIEEGTQEEGTSEESTDEETKVVTANFIGQQGLNRYYFKDINKKSDWRNLIETESENYQGKSLWTAFDASYSDFWTDDTNAFTGYFKAPDTAEYRFLMACDDQCVFRMSVEDPMNPASAQELMSVNSHTSYRNTDITDKSETSALYKKRFTDWVSLTKDQHYYVEAVVFNGKGAINLNVGMEVRPASIPQGHPKLEPQVQKVSLGYENIRFDTMEIKVINPDEGFFKMAMNKPTNKTEYYKTDNIKANTSAADLQNKIKKFYSSQYGVNPIVTLQWQNSDGDEVEEGAENIYSSTYTIQTPTTLTNPSVELIVLLKLSSKSQFEIVYPTEKQLSTPPLAGKFFMECFSPDGNSYPTQDMSIKSVNAQTVQNRLEADCGFLKNKIIVTQVKDTYTTNGMGVEFEINFEGVAADLKQYRMVSSLEDPPEYYLDNPDKAVPEGEDVEGGDQETEEEGDQDQTEGQGDQDENQEQEEGGDQEQQEGEGQGRRMLAELGKLGIVKNQSIVREFGTSLVWHVIPAEYLFTHETSPQIKVSIDGMPALCTGGACHYNYIVQDSQITAYTLTDNKLAITGTSLVEPIKIEMGYIACENIVVAETADSITCDLTDTIPVGNWLPEVHTDDGLVAIEASVAATEVTMTITSVSPETELNPAGGEVLTIVGTNFPPTIDNRYNFEVNLDDKALCIPFEQSSTQIKCETEPFKEASRRRQLNGAIPFWLKLKLKQKGIVIEEQKDGLTLNQDPLKVTKITPSKVSPIALREIEIQLSDSYPIDGMVESDFYVQIKPIELAKTSLIVNNGGVRDFNVIKVDKVKKTITIKYGGAYLGSYMLVVRSTLNGNLETTDVELSAAFELTEFSPKSGSIYGGTLLTLTGGPFTTDIEESIVKVGYKWWEGIDHYCYVESVSESEVTCRLPLDLNREAKGYEIILFASTYYESTCKIEVDVGYGCSFTFIASADLPKITGPAVPEFNTLSGFYQLKVPTSGVTDASKDIKAMIGQKVQSVQAASAEEIVVQIDDIESGLIANQMELYLSVGYPEGYNLLAGITFEPKLVALSTNKGSQAGSIIIADVIGMGVNDKLTLYDSTKNEDICATSKVLKYGKLECHTKASKIDTAVVLSVKEIDSNKVHECAAIDTSACEYQTFTEGSDQMIVSTASITNVILVTFTGTHFPTDGYLCTGVFMGAQTSSCTIVDDTEVLAGFEAGIPTVSVDTKPELYFSSVLATHYATIPDEVVLQNPLSVTAVSIGLQSSFAGGSTLQITTNGLTRDVQMNYSEVRVCSKPCKALESSTTTIFSCAVPPIATLKSNSEFKIQSEQNLKGQKLIFGGMTEAMAKRSLDDSILPSIQDSTTGCFVGVQFGTGYVGVVNEVSFFLDEFNVDYIVDHLKIQASTDNFVSSIETLVTVGAEAHEGWNFYDLTESQTKDPAKFKYYRLTSDSEAAKGCDDVGEIHWIGYEVIDSDADTYNCEIEIVQFDTDDQGVITETITKQSEEVTYSVALTPVVDSISPRYGDVAGGTQITFTGKSFDSDSSAQGDYSISIDDVDCPIDSFSATEIKCTTGPRIGEWLEDPKIVILKKGLPNVAMQDLNYRYCALWSKESTWGDLYPPIDGESVTVPKGLCLLVDIQKSPKLRLVQVDGGSLIFPSKDDDPSYQATFDARYIFVKDGLLEIGTEEKPYMSKLTITMHGEKYDPAMPLFGKKSIGVTFGTLDIHGAPKLSWTELDTTVEAGETSLTLVEEVDWEVGDEIMITSTDYDQYQAEFFKIKTVTASASKSTITIEGAFAHKHYAAVETHGTDTLTIRAEVCLMSRNIVYRGDPETSALNKFGAHIMLHSPGNESVVGRIENLQLEDVGQAFLLGKYPIHFHMIGRVTKSYVRNNAIRRSYNRGTTLHGVKYLRVERNCYWDVMGHTIFVEDAAETKNLVRYNVIAGTKPSFSLLNTDQTPGCFWITHPDNIFVGNRAAGSTHYGYWMDYQDTAIGPSFDPNIRPTQSKLGEFRGNVAHSIGNYGLRIFHGHQPPQIAYYEEHLSYRCGKKGIMGGDLGQVVFRKITVADNKVAGIEFERITLSPDQIDVCRAEDIVVVGRSTGNPGQATHGVVAPQSDLWLVTNARFYNFNNGAAAFGDCSHCMTPKADSGTRTTRTSKILFDSSVEMKVKFREPFKGILHDLDGTLTGQGADSYVSAYWKHNDWSTCTVDMDVYDGIICPSPYAIERIVFTSGKGNIDKKELYVWQYDEASTAGMDEEALEKYLLKENASEVPMLIKARPKFHWTVPYVTRHQYYIRWKHGLDFESVKVQIEPYIWEQADQSVTFVAPFYETRAAIEFTPNLSGLQANTTLLTTSDPDLIMGSNVVYNNTETREMIFTVNGREDNSELFIKGRRCIVNCEIEEIEENEVQATRLWSDVANWPKLDNRIPIAGEAVVIEDGYDIIYDIGDSPLFKSIEINGKLSFLQGQPATVNTYSLWVRAGEMNVGTALEPFNSTVEIKLHGNNTSESQFVFAEQIPVGNKNLIVTGTLNMFGKPRQRVSRLTQNLYPGQDQLFTQAGLDFVNGDKLGLPATNNDPYQSETVIVESYDSMNGIVKLTEAAKGYHFGAFASTAENYSGLDMRGEILLLSSNVNVTASTDAESMTLAYPHPFGCQILVADFFEPSDFSYRSGAINFDNVAVYNCSQEDTSFAGIKFHNAMTGSKKVTNSAISSGLGPGIIMQSSRMIELRNNVIHDFIGLGISGISSSDLTIDGNVISRVRQENKEKPPYMEWFGEFGGIDLLKSKAYKVTNNIVAGVWHAAFRLPAHTCGSANPNSGNIAHSNSGYGLIVAEAANKKCSEFKGFFGYKNRIATMHMAGGLGSELLVVKDLVNVDSAYGLMALGSSGGRVEVYDSFIYGQKGLENLDCFDKLNPKCSNCQSKKGILIPTFKGQALAVTLAPLKLSKMYKGGGTWGGTSLFKNIKFIGFDSDKTLCGARQAAIATNSFHSDYHPIADYEQIEFRDTVEKAMFYLGSPSKGWANDQDCGTFTCTGLYNVLLRLEGTKFSGSPMPFGIPRRFSVTANNKESISAQVVPRCDKKTDWNAFLCTNPDLGVLLFESQDGDRMDRSAQPIYIIDEERGFENRLNAYMDDCWDGAYTCQKREQRFPTFLEIGRDYRIEYTGTPPEKQRFSLYGESYGKGNLMTIPYPDKGAYKVYKDSVLAIPTDWDYNTENWAVPTGKYCGENRMNAVKNELEFWITPGCTLVVYPRDAIMLAVRLEWTKKAFFQSGGIGKFTDRMAAVLLIPKADMKVVQVYEGSVIVEFEVLAPEDDPDPAKTLQALEQRFTEVAPTLGDSLGAPIMQILTSQGQTIPMAGYDDLSSFKNNKDFKDLIAQFLADREKDLEERIRRQELEAEQDRQERERKEKEEGETDDGQKEDKDDKDIDKPVVEREVIIIKQKEIIEVEEVTVIKETANKEQIELFLIVIVGVLVVLVIGLLIIFCLNRVKKRQKKIILSSDVEYEQRANDDVGAEIDIFDDSVKQQQEQYDPSGKNHLGFDIIMSSRKHAKVSTKGASADSLNVSDSSSRVVIHTDAGLRQGESGTSPQSSERENSETMRGQDQQIRRKKISIAEVEE